MKTGTRWTCLGVLSALILHPGPVPAQEIRTTSVLVGIPRLSELDISGDVSQLLSLTPDASGESAFDTGYVESATNGTILTMSTNAAWDLSARLGGPWTCPGSYDKAEADLLIKITQAPLGTIENGANGFIGLTESDLLILSYDQPVDGYFIHLQTQTKLTWTKDVPGDYSISLTYTLVTHVP